MTAGGIACLVMGAFLGYRNDSFHAMNPNQPAPFEWLYAPFSLAGGGLTSTGIWNLHKMRSTKRIE